MFGNTFYDKFGNFDNKKFVDLLVEARKLETKKRKGGATKSKDITLFSSVGKKDVWGFINKMSIFINSGIDIKSALTIVVKQISNPKLKDIANEMRLNIDQGITIAETMQQYPKVFDTLIIALLGVGEKTGQLGKVLNEVDTSLLESIELKAKVKGAMTYPMILLTLTIGVVVFLMTFVVPKVIESFQKTKTALPKPTQIVVNISNFFINDWHIFLISIIVFVILIKLIKKTNPGRMFFAILGINAPVFGFIVKQSNIIYFIKSFTTLLDSGVLLLDSLKIASDVVPNLAYKKELIRIKNEVEVGLPISKSLGLNLEYEDSLYLNKLFNEEFAYVVSTGEETGTLSDSLRKIGKNYDGELKRKIANLSSSLEPIIIIIVGFLVGSIVISIMLPFFELGKIAGKM